MLCRTEHVCFYSVSFIIDSEFLYYRQPFQRANEIRALKQFEENIFSKELKLMVTNKSKLHEAINLAKEGERESNEAPTKRFHSFVSINAIEMSRPFVTLACRSQYGLSRITNGSNGVDSTGLRPRTPVRFTEIILSRNRRKDFTKYRTHLVSFHE